MIKKSLLALAIAIAYIIVGFLLYRERVISTATVWDSDLLVFALPLSIAFAAFCFVLWPRSLTSGSQSLAARVRAVALSALATAVSAYIYTFLAFNRYGT